MKEFFFLKVWAKNMGVHYTQQNMVTRLESPLTQSDIITAWLWRYYIHVFSIYNQWTLSKPDYSP